MTQRDRDELIQRIHEEQRLWRELVAEVGRERMSEPGPMGEWTFKDLVSHLAGWRNRTLARLEAVARGRHTPADPWPSALTDDDAINAWIRDRDLDRSVDDLLADYDRSFERLAAVTAALPDDVLTAPGRFPWMGDIAFVDAPLFGHLHEEHEPAVRRWLRSRTDTPPRG
jgi:hypothetical protein